MNGPAAGLIAKLLPTSSEHVAMQGRKCRVKIRARREFKTGCQLHGKGWLLGRGLKAKLKTGAGLVSLPIKLQIAKYRPRNIAPLEWWQCRGGIEHCRQLASRRNIGRAGARRQEGTGQGRPGLAIKTVCAWARTPHNHNVHVDGLDCQPIRRWRWPACGAGRAQSRAGAGPGPGNSAAPTSGPRQPAAHQTCWPAAAGQGERGCEEDEGWQGAESVSRRPGRSGVPQPAAAINQLHASLPRCAALDAVLASSAHLHLLHAPLAAAEEQHGGQARHLQLASQGLRLGARDAPGVSLEQCKCRVVKGGCTANPAPARSWAGQLRRHEGASTAASVPLNTP